MISDQVIQTHHKKLVIVAATMGVLIGAVAVLPMKVALLITCALLIPVLLLMPIEYMLLAMALFIFVDKSFISIQGSYVRIYQVLFLVMLIKFVVDWTYHRIRLSRQTLFWLINVWVLSYFLALPHLISPKDFWFVVIGQIFLNVFYYASTQVIYAGGYSVFNKALKCVVLSGLIVALVGMIEWIFFFLFGIDIGIGHFESIGIPRPSSLAYEPDWYGLFSAYTGIWLFIFYIKNDQRIFGKKLAILGALLCFLGVFISMARASMVAVFAAILLLYVITRDRRIIKYALISILVIGILFTGLFVVDQGIANNIVNRLNPFTSLETDSGAADSRLASIDLMLDYIPQHPIVGNGSGGMAKLSQLEEIREMYIYGGELNAGKGNANIFLTVLFDTGIIGLTIFIGILIKVFLMIKQSFSRQTVIPLGFAATSLLILVNFNFNNGFRMGFVWFHLALITAYYLLVKESRHGCSK